MFSRFFKEFEHYLRFEKRYSVHTLTAYTNDLQQFSDYVATAFDHPEITAISHFHFRSWLASLKEQGHKERSINRKLSSLNGYYKYLLKKGVLTQNPLRQLHSMRLPERLPTFLKETETEHLFEEVSFDEGFKGFTNRLVLDLLYVSGMRRSELLGLKESDIEWGQRQIRVWGKGNKERLIPVGQPVLDSIKDYIAEKNNCVAPGSNCLLVLPSGKPLYAGYVYRVVKHYLSMVTTLKKKSPHILRHTFATHLLNNGASIQAIKELLGHSGIASTQIYTHINIDKLKKVHKLNHPRG